MNSPLPATNPDQFLFRFPPFPSVPPGVHIIPFKEFKEFGICISAGPDDVTHNAGIGLLTPYPGEREIDALGVQTVMLRKRHDTDVAKTDARKKKQKRLEEERLRREEEERREWEESDAGDFTGKGTGWNGPGNTPTNKRRKLQTQTWYEEWEVNEESRVMGPLNLTHSPTARLLQAIKEFQSSRKWPPTAAKAKGPNYLWDQFKVFLGVPEASRKTGTLKELGIGVQGLDTMEGLVRAAKAAGLRVGGISDDDDSGDDVDDSDGDDDLNMDVDVDAGAEVHAASDPTSTPPEVRKPEPETVQPLTYAERKAQASEERKQLALKAIQEERDAALALFMGDPATSLNVFMSEYGRRKGIIWAEINTRDLPRLLTYFINFLLRSKAFHGFPAPPKGFSVATLSKSVKNTSELADDEDTNTLPPFAPTDALLQRALTACTQAAAELPHTGAVAHSVPDAVARACMRVWGRRAEGYHRPESPEVTVAKIEEVRADDDKENDEAKNDPAAIPAWPGINFNISEDASLKPNTNGWGAASDESWDDFPSVPLPSRPVRRKATVPKIDPKVLEERAREQEAQKEREERERFRAVYALFDGERGKVQSSTVAESSDSEVKGIKRTHRTGVVEYAMRRVKSITLPPKPVSDHVDFGPLNDSDSGDKDEAPLIEALLAQHFARVVMEPWLNWDRGTISHLSCPRILESSQGDVVSPTTSSSSASNVKPHTSKNKRNKGSHGSVGAHDPEHDDITLLVIPDVAAELTQGMGLGGTYVQITRLEDQVKEDKLTYWYLEELPIVIPAFWEVAPGTY